MLLSDLIELYYVGVGQVAQSVQQLTTGWMVWD